MKDGKIVVLQVLGTLNVGGAESRIMDILRNIDKTKIQYDFLLHDDGKDAYEDEAISLGSNIYRVPRFRFYNMNQYKRAMNAFFKAHPEIDIVQGHITSSAAIYLPIAKKHGVKATISHVRSAGVDKGLKGWLTNQLRKDLPEKTGNMWACSSDAAIAVYGEDNYKSGKVRVIPNAIDVDSFALNEEIEAKAAAIRREYGIDNKFVVGHVGRFHYAKNHEFLIDVFEKISKIREDAVLLLVGEGSLMEDVKVKAESLGVLEKVVFAGRHSNVTDFYHAMDLIVFPSRYEGLPGTIVESQAAGIPALVSNSVTKDVGVTKLVRYKSLEDTSEQWATEALELYNECKGSDIDAVSILKEKGFDVKTQVMNLEKLYEKLNK